MSMSLFHALLQKIPAGRHVVSLQGEGEPLAHPQFFSLATQVWQAGHIPYVITNCSLAKSQHLPVAFPRIGISLDTVETGEAERIGRRQLKKVLSNLERLVSIAGPDRIAVHTVDMGQPLGPLRKYIASLGIEQHIVQALQTKDDYRRHYPIPVSIPVSKGRPLPCRYVARPSMKFFNIDGIEMPCAYIKDATVFRSAQALSEEFEVGEVPAACTGCREIEWTLQ